MPLGTRSLGPGRVSETWTDSRGGVIRALGRVATGVGDRAAHNRRGIEATLARIKAAAEDAAAPV